MTDDLNPLRSDADAYAGVLDLSVMEQLISLDDGALGLLEEMLGLYKEDTPDRLKALETTLGLGEMMEMADVAHAIKGAASTMGVLKVRHFAAELEGGGRQGTFTADPSHLLAELKLAYDESCQTIESFIARQK